MFQMKVGLVGLGRMGAAIAQRLNERGCEIVAWDRNPKAREAQAKRGLRIVNNPHAVANAADVVLSIITEDKGVRQIFAGPDGFLSGEIKGKLFIEMSTLQPMTHRELAPMVSARGASLVDSPVMGSIPTVREGKLLALLGGEAADVERASSVLDHLTRRIVHIGPNGAGCAMKLAVNLGMAVYLQSLAEAISLGASEGLKLDQMLDIFGEAPTPRAHGSGARSAFSKASRVTSRSTSGPCARTSCRRSRPVLATVLPCLPHQAPWPRSPPPSAAAGATGTSRRCRAISASSCCRPMNRVWDRAAVRLPPA
jgi:3-hydroxyisobutyrate dehydrogenase-like beta-hydroxyacid dehydrogenase